MTTQSSIDYMCLITFLLLSDDNKISSLLSVHSEGVFKCPEDQLPLDYAKVIHSTLISSAFWTDYNSISHRELKAPRPFVFYTLLEPPCKSTNANMSTPQALTPRPDFSNKPSNRTNELPRVTRVPRNVERNNGRKRDDTEFLIWQNEFNCFVEKCFLNKYTKKRFWFQEKVYF